MMSVCSLLRQSTFIRVSISRDSGLLTRRHSYKAFRRNATQLLLKCGGTLVRFFVIFQQRNLKMWGAPLTIIRRNLFKLSLVPSMKCMLVTLQESSVRQRFFSTVKRYFMHCYCSKGPQSSLYFAALSINFCIVNIITSSQSRSWESNWHCISVYKRRVQLGLTPASINFI